MESYLLLFLFTTSATCNPSVASWFRIQPEIEDHSNHSDLSSRVIGGEPAELGQLPYQLSLQQHGRHFCGAVLIKSTTIPAGSIALTAAHCVDEERRSTSSLTVMGGSVLLQDNSENSRQVLRVRKIIIHEDFNMPRHDIAILFLSGEFNLNDNLGAISLPLHNEMFDEALLVSGWGKTSVNPTMYTNALHFAEIPVVTNEKCAELYAAVYGNRQVIFDFNICAGRDEGGQDTCQGDSGGPGVGNNEIELNLHALTSWGVGCAEPGFPGIYTRISYYVNWISDQVAAEFEI